MGEHNQNVQALLNATLPTWPPPQRVGAVHLGSQVVPKRTVYLTRADREPDPEAVSKHAEACKAAGLEQVLHELGKPLAAELCDVVMVYVVEWGEHAKTGPVARSGAFVVPGEVCRMDMLQFMASAEGCLPEASRIVRPGLGAVR